MKKTKVSLQRCIEIFEKSFYNKKIFLYNIFFYYHKMIQIPQSYDEFLSTRKSKTVPVFSNLSYGKGGNIKFGALGKPKQVIIPPLNSDINFSSIQETEAPSYSDSDKMLPENFTLSSTTKISPVQNQYNCGCCWAFACAASLNDNLLCQNIVPDNPDISPSYLMSCDTENNKCQGGNPSTAFSWIEKNGISTNEFENFTWCSSNKKCTDPNFQGSLVELNNLVPKCKLAPSNLRFFIKNINRPPALQTDAEILSYVNVVKNKLMTHGSLLGGITVYENLISGNFYHPQKNSMAIYLDKVNYDTMTYQENDFSIAGFHAITVTGWGIGKVHSSLLGRKDNVLVKVPYWIVRNSWSVSWGINGYFHLAMYPFNKLCQLEKPVGITTSDSTDYVGGFIFFDLDNFGYKEDYEALHQQVGNGEGFLVANAIILAILILLFVLSLLYILSPFFFIKKK